MADFDLDRFAAEVETTAAGLLGSSPMPEDLVQTARAVQEMAETALARHRTQAGQIACGPGCGHCCLVNIAVLLPEAAAIADYLRRKLSGEELEALRERLALLHESLRGVDDDGRLTLRLPCVFLDARSCCTVYPVRPLLCRGLTSTDPQTCRDAVLLHPLGEAPPILIPLFQADLFDRAFIALSQALEKAGLETRNVELTGAVHTLLLG